MLTSDTCVPCKEGAPKLDEKSMQNYLAMIDGNWVIKQDPDRIIREIIFKDFQDALSFINIVGKISEAEGHHPNILLHDYKKLTIEIYTHRINGLHKNDFILAAKIDRAYKELTS